MTPCQARGRLFFHRACPRENGGQAVIPAQSLSLAKAGAGIHKKSTYFAVDSRLRICRLTKNPSLRSHFLASNEGFLGEMGSIDRLLRGNSLSPASARAGSGEGQGRCRKIIQSAIMKKSRYVCFCSHQRLLFNQGFYRLNRKPGTKSHLLDG